MISEYRIVYLGGLPVPRLRAWGVIAIPVPSASENGRKATFTHPREPSPSAAMTAAAAVADRFQLRRKPREMRDRFVNIRSAVNLWFSYALFEDHDVPLCAEDWERPQRPFAEKHSILCVVRRPLTEIDCMVVGRITSAVHHLPKIRVAVLCHQMGPAWAPDFVFPELQSTIREPYQLRPFREDEVAKLHD